MCVLAVVARALGSSYPTYPHDLVLPSSSYFKVIKYTIASGEVRPTGYISNDLARQYRAATRAHAAANALNDRPSDLYGNCGQTNRSSGKASQDNVHEKIGFDACELEIGVFFNIFTLAK